MNNAEHIDIKSCNASGHISEFGVGIEFGKQSCERHF